jgi:hypothetical protein
MDFPKHGDRSYFIGFNEHGWPFIMWWSERKVCWVGVGRDPYHPDMPIAFNEEWARLNLVRFEPIVP